MRQPPPLQEAHRYPVVSALAVAAFTATVAWWCKWDVESYVMSGRFWPGEPWRLITSTLLHVNVVHLAFNLYWLWVFGTLIEGVFGSLKTLGLVLLLAAVPSAAEYALLHGGVGLSGVGYGFFGLLWVLNRRDSRFFGAVDRATRRLFVWWFFICIATTVLEIMPVGNFAHGAGAAVGVLLGHAISSSGRRRGVFATALIVLSVLLIAAAGVWRPYVNLTRSVPVDLAHEGTVALQNGDNQRGAELLRKSVALDSKDARAWFNLGVACHRLGLEDEASKAYERAFALNPAEPGLRAVLAGWKVYSAYKAQQASQFEEAVRLYKEAAAFDRKNAAAWYNLGLCEEKLGHAADAIEALENAVRLDPNPAFREALESLRGPKPQH